MKFLETDKLGNGSEACIIPGTSLLKTGIKGNKKPRRGPSERSTYAVFKLSKKTKNKRTNGDLAILRILKIDPFLYPDNSSKVTMCMFCLK